MLEAPAFWSYHRPTLAARLLQPAGALYGAITARRMAGQAIGQVEKPVICVGNFSAGGTGKTPTAIAIAARLRAFGLTPTFLTRGYRGTVTGPHIVEREADTTQLVGDEALLLALEGPVVVSANRLIGAELAVAVGSDAIVMDDGFQNPRLHKDFSFVVVDGAVGVGNGLCLPAGPLRASVERQWGRVGALVIISPEDPRRTAALEKRAEATGRPVLRADLKPSSRIDALQGRPVLAFAGIGRPQKFFEMLNRYGVEVARARAYPDHHAYTEADARWLLREADNSGLLLATTAKDLVRLNAPDGALSDLRSRAKLVDVTLQFEQPDMLDTLLRTALEQANASPP